MYKVGKMENSIHFPITWSFTAIILLSIGKYLWIGYSYLTGVGKYTIESLNYQ
jgi:hypothetical protein